MSKAPIEIKNLIKNYGKLNAVNDVSFTMNPGEILGLLGPNGAGKTSIISTMVTLEKPTSGTVSIFGYNVEAHPREVKSLTGFVPQELMHHGYFDVIEILRFHSGYFGRLKNDEHIEYLLKRLGLWEHRNKKVKQLSGGMKRRLLIAKALVHEPSLLLLDEPTAGVDIELRESLWEFVLELKAKGLSILLTTHYLEEAEQLCDRVGILQKGELKLLGPTKSLIKDLTQREIVMSFKDLAPIVESHFLKEKKPDELIFEVPAKMGLGDLISNLKINIENLKDVQIREGNLEDAIKKVLHE
jgi:ABC-2 type transport system ATP-binding protein